MATKTYTYQDVAEHNTKKDLFMVIHDKVYDATKFIDEHPGGEEVMLDVAGQDATEAFEDVGHSDEARETLSSLLVGDLKRQVGLPVPPALPHTCPCPSLFFSVGEQTCHPSFISRLTSLTPSFFFTPSTGWRPETKVPVLRISGPGRADERGRHGHWTVRRHPGRRHRSLRRVPVPAATAGRRLGLNRIPILTINTIHLPTYAPGGRDRGCR
ncbi:hypothetical protein RB594_001533 [Gaeumannomyces avenae]